MAVLGNVPQTALLVLVVILIFNLIIFVHELGHYWAAKWRGLKIDRFQIWFGKPIWSKTVNGIQYGLGWIPAGGFVALPQMAPMEAIEGRNLDAAPLPPVKPLDKIIVAFAGPLFSFLLACLAAVVVWQVGKPKDFIPTQVIGEVQEGKPGQIAGLKAGDKITHINGKPTDGWSGKLDSVFMQIVTSEGAAIHFTVERPGVPQPLQLTSYFEVPETSWWQRKGLRQVGIGPQNEWIVAFNVMKGAPAERAGLEEGDRILSVDGHQFKKAAELMDYIPTRKDQTIDFLVERKQQQIHIPIKPLVPLQPEGKGPMVGVGFDDTPVFQDNIEKPTPFQQISETLNMMWVTVTRVISPSSDIGPSHLNGPVGIVKLQYQMLSSDEPWRRILSFLVLININLAILNMLPLPVLDGGHITLAIFQWIAGRPMKAKVLEYVQLTFLMLLMSLMLYVSSKDIFENVGGKKGDAPPQYVFPQP